jgi:putative transposase
MTEGHFPGATYPLSYVQIDHTPVDVILVDEITRRPVGRPWLTLVMDVFSRAVLGYHLSFDPPGDQSVGLALAHAILSKDEWLAAHKVDAEWPCWGIPETVHGDNAKEFRGGLLGRVSQEYGFSLEWRALGKPQYGGHIERLLGTFMTEIHQLQGTTFSSIAERKDYKSVKRAEMSLTDLEIWMANQIAGVYHNRPHSELSGETPMERFQKGLLPTTSSPGRGIPALLMDRDRVRLDFMPFVERTIQSYGIEVDGIGYYSQDLRTFIGMKDPNNPKLKRQFLVRRDPRDISVVYLLDPHSGGYLPIPYRDTTHPAISLWEWNKTKKKAKNGKSKEENETLRFNAIKTMRTVEEAAARKTIKARREETRRSRNASLDLHGKKAKSDMVEAELGAAQTTSMPLQQEEKPSSTPIVVIPFDDIA